MLLPVMKFKKRFSPHSHTRHPQQSHPLKIKAVDSSSPSCLCNCIKPILILGQLIGIAPLKFVHSDENSTAFRQHNSRTPKKPENLGSNEFERVFTFALPLYYKSQPKCRISANLCSFPLFINIVLTLSFISVTFWMMLNFKSVLKIYFDGTDLYTFGLQVELLYCQACAVLINASVNRRKVQELWELLQKVHWTLKSQEIDEFNGYRINYMKLKKISCVLTSATCFIAVLYAIYFVHFVFQWCFMSSNNPGVNPPCPLSDGILVLQKTLYALLVFYNLGFAAFFFSFCSIVWLLHENIGSHLNAFFKTRNEYVDYKCCGLKISLASSRSDTLEKLRISHESLCKTARLIGEGFGAPVLIVCISSVLSITCAVYTAALTSGVNAEKTALPNIEGFLILVVTHGFVAVLALSIILISGQAVKNSAERPIEIIASASHLNLSSEEKHQVCVFLQKIVQSSTILRACNVTNIGLSFLAGAATNVTTYILVILQFRLGVEPHAEGVKTSNTNRTG